MGRTPGVRLHGLTATPALAPGGTMQTPDSDCKCGNKRQVIGGEERQPGSVQMHVAQFEVAIVINMVEVQERQDAGVGGSAFQVHDDIGALHVLAEELAGQAASPFVEIADDNAMRRKLSASQDVRRKKLPCLFAAFRERGSQVKRKEVDGSSFGQEQGGAQALPVLASGYAKVVFLL